jgi:tRNA dimethylallyltransferase
VTQARRRTSLRTVGERRPLERPFALVGPTASGKTEASLELARRLDAEVVLVDSTTVYRGMDVGTAKPSPEQRAEIRHHLVDVADPTAPFSVAQFQLLARSALREVADRGRAALLVGGSGLYYRAVVDDLIFPGTDPRLRRSLEAEAEALGPPALHDRLVEFDPASARKIDPSNARRTVRALEVAAMTGRRFSSFAGAWDRYPPESVRAAGIAVPPPALEDRIRARVHRMLDSGLLEEVEALLARGAGPYLTASRPIGYVEAMEHLRRGLSVDEVVTRTVRRTKDLARRQMAWFRRDPRVRWFESEHGAAAVVAQIEEYFVA